jgi:hypothetical protein
MICTAAGGVLMMKSNDLSAYTVITTGSTLPALSCVRRIELLAELHDVHALGTQCGADRGCGVGGPAFHLQLDQALRYLLCHCSWFCVLR